MTSINFLYREFDRVLRKVKPKAFVVENVNGMAFGESRTLLENQLHRYRLAGYRVKWSVLNAKDFGVAQNRRRVFLRGHPLRSQFRVQIPETHARPRSKEPLRHSARCLERSSALACWRIQRRAFPLVLPFSQAPHALGQTKPLHRGPLEARSAAPAEPAFKAHRHGPLDIQPRRRSAPAFISRVRAPAGVPPIVQVEERYGQRTVPDDRKRSAAAAL